MAGRQRRQLFRTRAEEGTVADQDRTNTLLRESCEGHFEIAIGSGVRAAACRSVMMDGVGGPVMTVGSFSFVMTKVCCLVATFTIDWKGSYRIEGAAFLYRDRETGRLATIHG